MDEPDVAVVVAVLPHAAETVVAGKLLNLVSVDPSYIWSSSSHLQRLQAKEHFAKPISLQVRTRALSMTD